MQEDAEKMLPGPSSRDPSRFVVRAAAWLHGCFFTAPSCQQEPTQEAEDRPQRPKSFQQKWEYFQKLGEDTWGGKPPPPGTQPPPPPGQGMVGCTPLLGVSVACPGPTGMLTGQPQVKVKTMKPPAKVQIPQGEEPEEEPEEEPQRAG